MRQTKNIYSLYTLSRIFRYLFLGLLPLFFSACVVTRDCPIETLQPAKVVLPQQKQSILIYASSQLLSDAILSNEGTSGIPADSLIMNILQSLKSFWNQAPGFEEASISVLVTDDQVTPSTSHFDLVTRLDRLQIRNTYYGEQYYYQGWEAFIHVHYAAEWSTFDKTGKQLDEYTDRDLIVWPSGIRMSKAEAVLNLPRIYDTWWDTGIALARNYAKRIAPQWQTDIRNIYMLNKFPDLSEQAYTAMQNNGYNRAFNIWDDMLTACRKKGQKKIKSQIAYNMAVACEFENHLDEAITWVQKSINYSSNLTNTGYLLLLKDRQQQILLLDQQLNH